MRKHKILGFFLTLTISTHTQFLIAYPKTDSDFALLPPYCKVRFGDKTSAAYKNWRRKMGREWNEVHHYCAGIDYLNKAKMALDKKTRTLMFNKALHDLSYIQERTSSKFILQPEIATQKGRAYLGLNQDGAALQEFYKAIKINPKYTPAYSELSDYYSEKNEPEEAKKILEQGLRHKPKSKSLKRRLDKL